MRQWCLWLVLGFVASGLSAAKLTAEQVAQQVQLSHVLGQISRTEQDRRIAKIKELGVDGYYEWLQSSTREPGKTPANNTR